MDKKASFILIPLIMLIVSCGENSIQPADDQVPQDHDRTKTTRIAQEEPKKEYESGAAPAPIPAEFAT